MWKWIETIVESRTKVPMGSRRMAIEAAVLSTVLFFCGVSRADTTTGSSHEIKTDTTEQFKSVGRLVTNDTDTPPDGLKGPKYTVTVNPKNGQASPNWEIAIWHQLFGWTAKEASWAGICIQGEHKVAPHPGDNPTNTLAPIWSRPSIIPYGKTRRLAVWRCDPHEPIPHYDYYGVKSKNVQAVKGPPPNLREFNHDGTTVYAWHGMAQSKRSWLKRTSFSTKKKEEFIDEVYFVSTGPDVGYLTFDIGAINVLDNYGGLSGGIEAQYADDPFLSAEWSVSDLEYLGPGAEGGFEFGGGTITITDPCGKFTFDATFDEYFVDDTSKTSPLTSYALLDYLSITDVADIEDGPSLFLSDFVDRTMFGEGIDEEEFALFQGIDFAFITGTNLAELTDGFTKSASAPAGYTISQNCIPEPATLALLGLGALVLLRRRRG